MKKAVAVFIVVFVSICLVSTGCKPESDTLQPEANEEYSGGAATVFDQSQNAFGQQINGLSQSDGLLFFAGNSFFKQNWVMAPTSTTARDGLGPLFQARSCSSCHGFDGRGQPPITLGGESIGLLLRLSMPGTDMHGGPMPDPIYGDQLQDNSINTPGVLPEGKFSISYDMITGTYADGTPYTLRKPIYSINNLNYGNMLASLISPRVGQQIIGMGLLEAVSEQTITALADEADVNGDGISGKANYVWDAKNNTTALGRFGWKANQPSVFQQTCGALSGDLGITTNLFNSENCSGISNCGSLANGGTPEMPDDKLAPLVLYTTVLAVPARRNWKDQNVLAGKEVFTSIGCASCHSPKLQTGNSEFSAHSNQTIRPYTDMLLHDMGNDLADGRPDFLANGNEWRTPPLWGIGLLQTVNGHTFLMHDGRAANIEEAILWHGGEAEKAKNAFKNLNKTDRDKLIKFLNTL